MFRQMGPSMGLQGQGHGAPENGPTRKLHQSFNENGYNEDDWIRMLEDESVEVDSQGEMGFTSLHQAALKNCKRLAETLLKCGATVDLRNNYQETALLVCAHCITVHACPCA
jgi:hypothetical protein